MPSTRIFDRDTLLDLIVNAVPLFIMLFFIVGFVVYAPFGFDPLANVMQFVLVAWIFLALLLLTYLSAKVIATDEKESTVYLPGQATVSGAEPLEESDEE
ncbi:MAG: DUF6684 family protein [Haloferacaceae archaeon]